MAYPLTLALRYLGSKKRGSISVGTVIAILGVIKGVAALLTVMSVTGGFQAEFRDKVLGVNAHVLVLKHSTEFRNYREIMEQVRTVPGVLNVAPFSINPMMLAHGDKTATGVLLKGVDPKSSLGVDLDPSIPPVLDLPRHVYAGERGTCPQPIEMKCGIELLRGLRREGATPAERRPDLAPPLEPADPLGPGGAGVDEDAGAPQWLREEEMRRREKEKGKEKKEKKEENGGHEDPRGEEADGKFDGQEVLPEGAGLPDDDEGVEGAVTPDGGYKSQLPDEDELPPGVVVDQCEDPEEVKKLPGIVIGKSLAETLKLKLGDCVTVTSPTIGFQFSGGAVKPAVALNFRVMALFEAGFDQYDSKLVYTDLYEAQAFYDEGDTVTGVEMKIAEIDQSDDVVSSIKKVLSPASYRIMDWKELNRGLFTALLIQKVLMSGVLALIILVAVFTVVAVLIMVVLDKKKEISVLKAMGATDFAILRVFLYQGLFIGGVGTVLGLLLGLGVCKGLLTWAFPLDPKVYFIDHLPVLLRTEEFILTGLFAVVLCVVGTVLPSLWAASMLPAEGFRDQPGSSSGVEAPEVLGSAWEIFSKHWVKILAWGLLAIGLLNAGSYVVGKVVSGGSLVFELPIWVVVPVAVVLGPVLPRAIVQGLTLPVFLRAARDETPRSSGIASALSVVPKLVAVDVVRVLTVVVAFALLLVPGALLMFSWFVAEIVSFRYAGAIETLGMFFVVFGIAVAPILGSILWYGTFLAPYLVIERKMGPLEALVASWKTTRGRRIDLFLFAWLSGLAVMVGFFCVGVGAFVAITLVFVGEALIYVRLSRSLEPPSIRPRKRLAAAAAPA